MDPLDLAVIRGRLQQIADEMDLVHTRAAFSPIVSETWDRANALIYGATGEVVTQGTTSLPIFVYTMQASAQACLSTLGASLEEGDVIVVNDPYLGGTHLQDFKMLRPLFVDGRLVMVLINTAHIVDVGGALASGFDPSATDIFQEGLQISPTWLVRRGHERADVMRLILTNTRIPETQEGDLRAQLNALEVGVRRVRSLLDEYGVDTVCECIEELATRSEAQMRGYIAQMPPGAYEFTDFVESETDGEPLAVHLRLEVGDDIHIDFTGSSSFHRGPMNLAGVTTKTAALSAFKHLFPDVPINGGCFRPFRFTIPDGCFLNGRRPVAVGGYPEGSMRVLESIFGALGQALPDGGYAASCGTAGSFTLSGFGYEGSYYATAFPTCGGYGASAGSDGLVHTPTTIGLARFPSLEASEHDFPIVWEAMELIPDSGGIGQWRGGCGTRMLFRLERPATLSFVGDRARHHPFGVAGGGEGGLLELRVEAADGVLGGFGVAKIRGAQLVPGGHFEVRMPGGGGFGPADRRSPDALARDLDLGYVTEHALETVWRVADPRLQPVARGAV
jgi:N-methylhydantoinase B